ncbi:MAG: sigma-70 family RNA polymerase sigma factor [Clostridiales bacterium]|nr:sigma-70 family RNA polymerase sigma factor [Clostridiales bacterium]
MIIETIAMFMQKLLFFSAYVNNNSSFPKPLNAKEEAEYIRKFHEGDMRAKDILIHHNLRLVAHIVKKYSQTEEADDLISVGSLGLIKAINTYKEGHGTQFSTYAAKCIENEILMLLRVNKKHKNDCSIDDIISADEENNKITVMDLAFEEDNDVAKSVENVVLSEKLNVILEKTLTKREFEIIKMRYGLNNTPALAQREVADKLGISRSYISRLEKKALKSLKSVMNKDDYI